MLKKIAVCAVALVFLTSALKPTLAAFPPPTPPASSAAAAGSSAALGVGGGIAIGVIATAALLCAYDIWLKINGFKNWDGSPKVVKVHHHPRH